LNEVASTKSLKVTDSETKRNDNAIVRTGGQKAHPQNDENTNGENKGLSRRSAVSEERKQLKRNASENLKNLPKKVGGDLMIRR